MLRVSTRARRGNFVYTDKPAKTVGYSFPKSKYYSVECPTCSRDVDEHCILVLGKDKGYFSPVHEARKTKFANQELIDTDNKYLSVPCDECGSAERENCFSAIDNEYMTKIHVSRICHYGQYFD